MTKHSSKLSFEEKLSNFADLTVVHGLNLKAGQLLTIRVEANDIDLARKIAEKAYQRGARYVDFDLSDPFRDYYQLRYANDRDRNFFPSYHTIRSEQILDSAGAVLSLRCQSEPDLFSSLNPQHVAEYRAAAYDALRRLYNEGIMTMGVNWSLVGPPSPKWAQKIFPNDTPQAAVAKLWEEIFSMTFADQANCLELWDAHLNRLAERAKKLNALKIDLLHFSGGGTDLKVGLTPRSQFLAGRKSTPAGHWFCPNIPTFEAYTTPNWRRSEGTVRITRPAVINGTAVEGLVLELVNGEIVKTSADKHVEVYNALIATDPGARRLGEVALVGTDSPIYQSGLTFHHTLYDENAACHIATGRAYEAAIYDAGSLSKAEMDELGVNISKTHNDVMISSEEVSVSAKLTSGKTVPLLLNGAWVADFA